MSQTSPPSSPPTLDLSSSEPLKLALPEGLVRFRLAYPAVTPHTWSASTDESRMRPVSRHNVPEENGVGAGGAVIFEFDRVGQEPVTLDFALVPVWGGEPVDTRRVEVVAG